MESVHLWGWLGSIQMSIVNILWKKALQEIHCLFFLSRLVLSFCLITAQSLILILLQASFTFFIFVLLQASFIFFLASSAGSWSDCFHPLFQCHCWVSPGVSRPYVWSWVPVMWMGELCRLDVLCVRHWISHTLQWLSLHSEIFVSEA